jgi:hypothetical protein
MRHLFLASEVKRTAGWIDIAKATAVGVLLYFLEEFT